MCVHVCVCVCVCVDGGDILIPVNITMSDQRCLNVVDQH